MVVHQDNNRDAGEVRVIGLPGIPELEEGDDLARLLAEACARVGGLEPGDIVVVAQKAVSKVEGRVVQLDDVDPSPRAVELAGDEGDPRQVEVILGESAEVVRSRPPLIIARTRHGFVCASAGVDASNAKGPDTVILLPLDPDASAAALRARLIELTRHRSGCHRQRLVRAGLAAGNHRRCSRGGGARRHSTIFAARTIPSATSCVRR